MCFSLGTRQCEERTLTKNKNLPRPACQPLTSAVVLDTVFVSASCRSCQDWNAVSMLNDWNSFFFMCELKFPCTASISWCYFNKKKRWTCGSMALYQYTVTWYHLFQFFLVFNNPILYGCVELFRFFSHTHTQQNKQKKPPTSMLTRNAEGKEFGGRRNMTYYWA